MSQLPKGTGRRYARSAPAERCSSAPTSTWRGGRDRCLPIPRLRSRPRSERSSVSSEACRGAARRHHPTTVGAFPRAEVVMHSAGSSLLLEHFQRAGFGDQARSWVSTGRNLPIPPEAVEQVFGPWRPRGDRTPGRSERGRRFRGPLAADGAGRTAPGCLDAEGPGHDLSGAGAPHPLTAAKASLVHVPSCERPRVLRQLDLADERDDDEAALALITRATGRGRRLDFR